MRTTTILEKGLASAINAGVVLLMSLPIGFLYSWDVWRVSAIVLFFLYNLFFLGLKDGRSLGMMVTHSYWKDPVRFPQHFLHSILYTVSFSTLLIWIYFPFDLFLVNMLLLQLPTILKTGTTLHARLSGNLATVVRE